MTDRQHHFPAERSEAIPTRYVSEGAANSTQHPVDPALGEGRQSVSSEVGIRGIAFSTALEGCRKGVVLLLISVTLGCSNVTSWVEKTKSPIDQKREAHQKAAQQFEARRQNAEYLAALQAARQGNAAGAERTLTILLQRNPTHRDANLLLAECCVAKEDLTQAETILSGVVQREPDCQAAHFALAHLLESSGQSDRAELHFHKSGRSGLQALESAKVSQGGGDSSKQLPCPFATVAKTAPAATSLERLFQAHQDGNGEVVIAELDVAMFREPDNLQIPLVVGKYLLQRGSTSGLQLPLQSAIRRFPEQASLYRLLGAVEASENDYESSQVALQQALSLDKSNALAYFLMGRTLSELGREDEAKQHFARATQLDPRFAQRR